ncbi:MAG: hypothetical protein KDB13_01130, partial [Microthrixaceae bacterium]|nr:hypothetical protein [Microthrixaceae bacterium]
DTREDMLHINPSLPVGLHELAFSISYRGQLVSLEISHERVRVRLADDHGRGAPVTLNVAGRSEELEPGGSLEMPID